MIEKLEEGVCGYEGYKIKDRGLAWSIHNSKDEEIGYAQTLNKAIEIIDKIRRENQ